MKKNLRLIAIGAAALLVVIVVLQNTQTVETRFLFMRLEMPRAVLLLATAAAGFVAGLVVGGRTRRAS